MLLSCLLVCGKGPETTRTNRQAVSCLSISCVQTNWQTDQVTTEENTLEVDRDKQIDDGNFIHSCL